MNTFADEIRMGVEQYVTKVTVMVNILLLVCHTLFGVYFWTNDAEIVYYYNCISIILYIAAFDVLQKRKVVLYIAMVYIEITIFMMIAVLCMGWNFGFHQYCIGLIIGTFFLDFYTTKERKIKKATIVIVIVEVILYITMRILTYRHPRVYEVKNDIFAEIFFVVNTLAAFAIMIAFCCIYSTAVFQLEKNLLNVASVDPMTGLRNRRRMHDLLNMVMDEYKKNPCPVCIGMLDVDHFKRINDTYGHDVGDIVLKQLAGTLLFKHEKKRDFHVCRWGGEEFLVLYKNCPEQKEEVYQEFERLRKEIEETTVVSDQDDKIKFTITIGLAFFEDDMSVTELLKLADSNLYKGKESGRNRVIWQ